MSIVIVAAGPSIDPLAAVTPATGADWDKAAAELAIGLGRTDDGVEVVGADLSIFLAESCKRVLTTVSIAISTDIWKP